MQEKELNIIPGLFRAEYGKILAILCSRFPEVAFEVVEDVLSDTFYKAMQLWPHKGVPVNPEAWLYTVSKNGVLSHLRSLKKSDKLHFTKEGFVDADFTKQELEDSQLNMIVAVCNTTLSDKAKMVLVLNVLCGFSANEIAAALLTDREAIYKILQRSKVALKHVLYHSGERQSVKNIDVVLHILYLLFNEGYHASVSHTFIKSELCFEAMQLLYFLLSYPEINTDKANALMALMCYQASRIDARIKGNQEMLYHNQDVSLWNKELIAKGDYHLQKCIDQKSTERYTIEAAIAYWHAHPEINSVKWKYLLKLYDLLKQINTSPVILLNYIFVYSKVYGNESAFKILKQSGIPQDHYYFTLGGVLLKNIDTYQALNYFQAALVTARDKEVIRNYIGELISE